MSSVTHSYPRDPKGPNENADHAQLAALYCLKHHGMLRLCTSRDPSFSAHQSMPTPSKTVTASAEMTHREGSVRWPSPAPFICLLLAYPPEEKHSWSKCSDIATKPNTSSAIQQKQNHLLLSSSRTSFIAKELSTRNRETRILLVTRSLTPQ